MAAGRIKRLIVSIPPRHGKSELISKYLPGWWLGTFPTDRIILATYGADFSATWGRKARDTMIEHAPSVFNLKVSDNVASEGEWEVAKHGGQMKTVGVMGPITGRGANLFIMDDPIKNDREALSKVYREHLWDWYRSTAYTRLEPDGRFIVIQARWHEDDVTGRLLDEMDKGGEEWVTLNLPALAQDFDPLGRKPDEALWPERFDEFALAKIRRTVGEFWWNALYMGHPMPPGGGLFKREHFRYFDESPEAYILYNSDGTPARVVDKNACWLFMTGDLAVSAKSSADYTVFCVWAVTPTYDLLLLDMARQRLEHPDQGAVLKTLHAKHGYRSASIDIESTQYQLALVQEMVREGLPVLGIRADKDKMARAIPAATRMTNHTIYFRAKTEWVDDVEVEVLVFTGQNDKHDDIVDNLSLAARRIAMGEGELELWTEGENPKDTGFVPTNLSQPISSWKRE